MAMFNYLCRLQCHCCLQEALIRNLIDWAQMAPNPLQSYAAGLLASAMEIQDIAAVFKDSNATLVVFIW